MLDLYEKKNKAPSIHPQGGCPRVLREEFLRCTLLTVAHRVQTILDYAPAAPPLSHPSPPLSPPSNGLTPPPPPPRIHWGRGRGIGLLFYKCIDGKLSWRGLMSNASRAILPHHPIVPHHDRWPAAHWTRRVYMCSYRWPPSLPPSLAWPPLQPNSQCLG